MSTFKKDNQEDGVVDIEVPHLYFRTFPDWITYDFRTFGRISARGQAKHAPSLFLYVSVAIRNHLHCGMLPPQWQTCGLCSQLMLTVVLDLLQETLAEVSTSILCFLSTSKSDIYIHRCVQEPSSCGGIHRSKTHSRSLYTDGKIS